LISGHNWKVAKNGLLASRACPSISLSIRMQQFGSHWMDFHEI
jgi:hypothetical protein